MQQTDISSAVELIRNPERMNRATVDLLKRAIERYPYHQALYLLLLQNLYKVHDSQFGEMLKKYAVLVADRSVLFDMVEGLNYAISSHEIDGDDDAASKDGDRTLVLIDSFLHSLPESPQSGSLSPADPSSDYSAYLEGLPDYPSDGDEQVASISAASSESAPQQVDTPSKENISQSSVAEPRILAPNKEETATIPSASQSESEVHHDAPHDASHDSVPANEFTVEAIRNTLSETGENSPDESVSSVPESEYFTETMAGIYIKQQKYAQALEIIRVLSAANPKKSVYFADQIRYLKLLVKLKNTKEQQ